MRAGRIVTREFLIDAGIAVALFAGNLLIAAPYLSLAYSSQPWNNDYLYIAFARMFSKQSGWNPLQYCGGPSGYAYPPLFHAVLAAMPVSLERAYYLVSGCGYAFVPVALFAFARQLFPARIQAVFAAAAYSVLPSPVYYVLPFWGNATAAFHHAPWGFYAMMAYREAAHTLAMAMALLALAAAWRGRWTVASFFGAAVFLLNWPGLIGFLMGLAALGIAASRKAGIVAGSGRAAAVAGTAYGIAAFWMPPGFFANAAMLQRTWPPPLHPLTGMPAGAWTATIWVVLALAAGMAGLALWRRTSAGASFILVFAALTGAVVAGFSLTGQHLVPLPNRYVMELTVALILAIAFLAGLARRWCSPLLVLIFAFGLWEARTFLHNAWALQPGKGRPSEMWLFQFADQLKRSAGTARVFAAGELEGSLNAVSDVAQVSGSGQGLSNPMVFAAHRQVALDCSENSMRARLSELWLRALDVRFVAVHDGHSREHYHWLVQPEAFDGLPAVWTNGRGDTIRRLPPPEQHQAVVADLTVLRRLARLRSVNDIQALASYVSWAQGRPARIRWADAGTAHIEADAGATEGVLVKINHDRGWRVSEGSIERDPIGFLLLRLPPGRQRVTLSFRPVWDIWAARAITILTIAMLLFRVRLGVIAGVAAVPAVAMFAVLATSEPNRSTIAEEAVRRLQPPMIEAGGIVGVTADAIGIYGTRFGGAQDSARVWVGGVEARIMQRRANYIEALLPPGATPQSLISVEVNGCRGNAFPLAGQR